MQNNKLARLDPKLATQVRITTYTTKKSQSINLAKISNTPDKIL